MPKPLYKNIASQLTKLIVEGSYKYNQILPSENALARKYKVSRVTIRKALDILNNKQLIAKKHGSGSYICYDKNNTPINQRATKIISFSEEMKSLGKTASSSIEFFKIIQCPFDIAQKLNISSGKPVYYFQRIRYGNDIPFCTETSYMDATKYDDLTIKHILGSKYEYIEKIKKQSITYSYQKLHTKLCDSNLSKQLNIPKETPVLSIESTTYLADGQVLDYSIIDANPNVYEIHYIKMRK